MTDTPANRSVWKFQLQVIKALVLRDMMARYGQTRMSYLWAFIAPALVIVGLLLIFTVRGRLAPPNIPLLVFLLTGFPLWYAFQGLWQQTGGAERSGGGLLMFPQITILDVVVARVLLEWATQTAFFFLLCVFFIVVVGVEMPADPGSVLMAFWSCLLLGTGVGLFAASVRRIFPMFEDWLSPIRRLGVFISGVIHTAASTPSFMLPYLDWNPIFRSIEWARQAWHPTYQSPIYNPPYVMLCCLGVFAVAMISERLTRRYAGQ